jgi:hypothetical protein
MTEKPAAALVAVSAGHQRPAVRPHQVFASVTGRPDWLVTPPTRPLTGRICPLCGITRGVFSPARWQPRRANPGHQPAVRFAHLRLSCLDRARSDDCHPGEQARRATGCAASPEPRPEKHSVASSRAPRPQREVLLLPSRGNEKLREQPAKPAPRPRVRDGG